jgi:hypothetical protein
MEEEEEKLWEDRDEWRGSVATGPTGSGTVYKKSMMKKN